ncbi:LL-diaminopimelate aminotransferase [Clostridia bacterium]|nr:LL-diaminopimelate aminotransferase [Clostridia bacterium]
MKINESFLNLKESYLFRDVSQRVAAFKAQNPDKTVYRLGIGDVTLPLVPPVVEALTKASAEMGNAETFRGYPEDCGYLFLRAAISRYYAKKGVAVSESEIFVSDGAKSDVGNIADIFDKDNTVLIPDPVYPVYVDSNIMAGREISYVKGSVENNFLPMPDKSATADIIYLCSPNNPTGGVYSRAQLKEWVDFANERGAVILFDAAYEIFVKDDNCPSSIFEIDGAKECSIEFCSFSKTAGFTGTRCGYTVISDKLIRGGQSIAKLWLRRQSTKFNGVAYVIQRGAEAAYSDEGLTAIKRNIAYYMDNAKIIADALKTLNIWFTGGENSPYVWLKCPKGLSSWEFFDFLLNNANVVGTPGAGFGDAGEGFFRLTAFGGRENITKAMTRFKEVLA